MVETQLNYNIPNNENLIIYKNIFAGLMKHDESFLPKLNSF